jgi:DNA-binding transcriptional MerR regulator
MLRYYEKAGLITPDEIDGSSRYRYYGVCTMQRIQAVRYLIDSGFSLDEIRRIFEDDDMFAFQKMFEAKIARTEDGIKYYYQRLDSLRSWCALLIEGQWVLNHRQQTITTKYVPARRYFSCEREQDPSDPDAQSYLEIEYFTMSKRNGHSMVDVGGAFYARYGSYRERISGRCTRAALLQQFHPNSRSLSDVVDFGGFMAVSGYHIGGLASVPQTYERLVRWADEHSFRLRGDCCERHVLDLYSTGDSGNYVTEILLPVEDDAADFALLERWEEK